MVLPADYEQTHTRAIQQNQTTNDLNNPFRPNRGRQSASITSASPCRSRASSASAPTTSCARSATRRSRPSSVGLVFPPLSWTLDRLRRKAPRKEFECHLRVPDTRRSSGVRPSSWWLVGPLDSAGGRRASGGADSWNYSRRYARTVWARREVAGKMEEYISHFQLLPPRNEVGEPITYYIDATMRQWFEDYDWGVGRRVRSDALAREREAYLSSRYVAGMSDWCAEGVVSSYGVRPEQVRTILPGASSTRIHSHPRRSGTVSCRRFGWALSGSTGSERAGPLLLDAASILGRMGYDVEVVVLGPDPSRVPAHPSLQALGTSTRVASSNDSWRSSRAFTSVACFLESRRSGSRRSSTFASAYRSRRPWEALSIPRAPARGFRSADGERVAELRAEVLREPARYATMRKTAARDGVAYRWD
jgi:hypothetical protein